MLVSCRFLYVSLPLALSITASVRIASLLASQNAMAASLSARLIVFLGVILSGIYSYATYQLRDYIGYLFSTDQETRKRVATLAPAAAVFHLSNSLQACCQGVLRGCGEQGTVVLFNFLSLWVFGFPAGVAMAFYARPGIGMEGIWYGFALGAGMQTIVLVGLVISADWDREVRKARLRISSLEERRNDDEAEGLLNSDGVIMKPEPLFGIPRPGSRALGGFLFYSKTGDEELDDFERIEIRALYDHRAGR
jgi:hypothetical protein